MMYAPKGAVISPTGGMQLHTQGYGELAYDRLLEQIRTLKYEQSELHEARSKLRDFEASALLKQQQRYEAHLASSEQRVAELQEQVRANNERAAKSRQMNERDKRKMQAEIDRLEKEVHVGQTHRKGEVDRVCHEYELKLVDMAAQMREMDLGLGESKQLLEIQTRQEVQNVEDWCQGEVAALKHR